MWAGRKWRLWRSEAIYIEKIIMITLRQVLKIMAICKAKDRCHFHICSVLNETNTGNCLATDYNPIIVMDLMTGSLTAAVSRVIEARPRAVSCVLAALQLCYGFTSLLGFLQLGLGHAALLLLAAFYAGIALPSALAAASIACVATRPLPCTRDYKSIYLQVAP